MPLAVAAHICLNLNLLKHVYMCVSVNWEGKRRKAICVLLRDAEAAGQQPPVSLCPFPSTLPAGEVMVKKRGTASIERGGDEEEQRETMS